MVAETEEHGQNGGGQQPPFLLSFVKEQAEDEQEDCDRTHIHRSGRERLRSPVKWQRLGDFVGIALSGLTEQSHDFGFVRID